MAAGPISLFRKEEVEGFLQSDLRVRFPTVIGQVKAFKALIPETKLEA
jgi:hypothetical protein